MANEWLKVSLDEVTNLRNGAGVKQEFFSEKGVPLARVSDFTQDSIDLIACKFVDHYHAKKWKSHFLSKGDVIVATVGSWPPNWSSVVGKVVCAPEQAVGAIQNQNTCCLKPDTRQLDGRFLFYRLKLEDFVWHAANSAGGSASQARLPVKELGKFTFDLPSVSEQKAIAHVLGSLDDRIELNRRMNETLEGMAQALFKSWFVDFDPVLDNAIASGKEIPPELKEKAAARATLDSPHLPKEIRTLFPDEFSYSDELGWIPKGWEVAPLGDVTVELRRGISPKYTEDGGVRVINQRCIRNHEVNYSLARRNDENKRKVKGRFLEEGDLLVNSTGVGTLGRMAQVHNLTEPSVVDSHVTIARADRSKYYPYTFARMMLSIEPYIEAMGEGSTGQTELSRKNLAQVQVIVPPMNNQKVVEEYFNDFVEKISLNSQYIDTLSLTRNTLLPKLLSGEIRIPDAEKMVAELGQ